MHGYVSCGSQHTRNRGLVVMLVSGWVRIPRAQVREPLCSCCMESWSWGLQRPHLRAGNFAVIVSTA
eukprot:3978630-Prymnesium_polylepis.2